MEARKGASTAAKSLAEADKQIADLKDRYLPHIPHLLSITTDYPYRPEFPHENQNTPFAWWEVKALQYMTLVTDGDRGIANAKGNWEEEYAAPPSASVRSSTGTPNPFSKEKDPKKASVKYSIKDYKNMKQTGVKPSPRPVAADAERKLGHSRNISNMSLDTPMTRAPSSEGPVPEARQNGASGSGSAARIGTERSTAPRSNVPEAKENGLLTNGHVKQPRDSSNHKDSNAKVTKSDHALPPPKHGLPPRPQSPPREKHTPDPKPQKRPLDSATAPPEKRTKIETSRTPSGSQNSVPRKQDLKPSPVKVQKQQTQSSQDSPQSRKNTPSSKPNDSKTSSKSSSNKPLDLPPLLSPLPADLENGPSSQPSGFSSLKKPESGRNSSANTPSKSKIGSDTIVVKSHKSGPPESSPLPTPSRSESPFKLPPLLSPKLPPVIEAELHRLQQKAQNSNTVEARHEKARQPGAPGVAQKAPRPKVGHPPKRSYAESSRSQEPERAEVPPSLIVKLKYKKQSRQTIERILKLRPMPHKENSHAETARKSLQPSALPKDFSDSEEDTPLAAIPKPTPPSRKRPSAEPRPSEPAPKRPKSDSISAVDTAKSNSTPVKHAFKSPAMTAPPERNLLSTPKKGEAMKTVATAMRRNDSNDGNARTPQATSTSTPASAEKPRINGETRLEIDRLKTEEKRLTNQALKLKHKMDDILKNKSQDRSLVSESQKKLGLCVGLECVVVYMNAFSMNIRIQRKQGLTVSTQNWESLLKLWEFLNQSVAKIPVLLAISTRLGALCREELRRLLLEGWSGGVGGGNAGGVLDSLKRNEMKLAELWRTAQGLKKEIEGLDVKDSLGSWSTVVDAGRFVVEVLGKWEEREGMGWKRDS